jgi:PAS domain S-box-containing protein
MNNYHLSELIDLPAVQKMADANYKAAGMPIGIIDAFDGSILVGTGWQEICVKFHRSNPESLKRCQASDNYIKHHLLKGEACRYKCKNGLWDIGIPIVVAECQLATLFLGQFFYEGEIPDRDFFIRQAVEFGYNLDDYLSALDQVPVFNVEKVNYIIEYNKSLVDFITDLAEDSISKSNMHRALLESEQRYRRLTENSPDMIYRISLPDGNYEYVSSATTCIFGLPPEAWYDNPFLIREIIHPDWHSYFDEQRENILKGHAPPTFEYKIIHKDESIRWINQRNILVKDDGGRPVAIEGVVTDITERKRAEDTLLESENKYRIIAENTADVISTLDMNLNYTYISPGIMRLRGFTVEEAMKQTLDQSLTPESMLHAIDVFEKEMLLEDSGTADPDRTRILELGEYKKDGSIVWQEVSLTFLRNKDRKPVGILTVSRDITEKKQAEKERENLQAQLIQAQKMESVGRLAGGVAHDFNNMLSAILGHAQLAMMRCTPSEPIHAHLKVIEDSANRSANLTRQLLAFARKQIIAPKVLDINDTVSSMLKMLRRLIGEDIDLAWRPVADLWQVKIDPTQIDQLLANLCVNARDSIAGVGKVTIETGNTAFDDAYCAVHLDFVSGEYVMLAVSDNGCGMDKETLPHIFEPFFTTKEEGKGTGLGLATVYGIVKQNNGFINVYSEPDKGTTFKIYLPRVMGEGIEPSAESTSETPKGHGEVVLLVEDEPVILDVSREMLEQLGYAVLIAGTPGEAIRIAKAHASEIQMLITDVVMPEMNGRDLANLIRDIKPGLKCLYISGYTANVIAHHGMLGPGINFIQKPFSMEHLAIKVREVLDESKGSTQQYIDIKLMRDATAKD